MPVSTHVTTTFTSGELSPKLKGRADLTQYHHGAETLDNFIPLVQGGLIRRPGTRFVASVYDQSMYTRMIPFEHSADQSYMLEVGDRYIRVFRDRQLLLTDGELTSAGSDSKDGAGVVKITVTGDPNADETIELISTDGTAVTYTAKSATSASANEFIRTGTDTEVATGLKTCIEHASGHAGKITVSQALGVLTLTQAQKGGSGNTTVTEGLANVAVLGNDGTTANKFTGGYHNYVLLSPLASPGAAVLTFTGTPSVDDTIRLKSSEIAATATITFTDVPNLNETIAIISTDGTNKTYTAKNITAQSSREFERGATGSPTVTQIAAGLKSCIEHDSGHAGKITVTQAAGVLTLTQATSGTAGNTTITESLTNVTKTNFTGGAAQTSVTYTAKSTETLGSNQFAVASGVVATIAESLKDCIEHSSGHNGKIIATRTAGVLVLQQATHGVEGNTTLNSGLDNCTVTTSVDQTNTQFVGGNADTAVPFVESELRQIKYAQSADILFLCHKNHNPLQVNRTADTTWTTSKFNFARGPWEDTNTTNVKLKWEEQEPGDGTGVGSTVTIKSYENDEATTYPLFSTTDAPTAPPSGIGLNRGRLIRAKFSTNWGSLRITEVTSDHEVSAIIKEDIKGTGSSGDLTTDWRLGAWSNTTGWPEVPLFHQARFWIGGRTNAPQTLWGSVTNDFSNFQPSDKTGAVADSDGMSLSISDDRVNSIRSLISTSKGMILFTEGGEWVLSSRSTSAAITPTSIQLLRQSTYGVTDRARPIQAGIAGLFIQRAGRKLREMSFSYDADQYIAPDMNLLAEHVFDGTVVETAYQQEPGSILWFITENETELIGFTYQREQGVTAWHRHPMDTLSGGNKAKIQSIAVIPDTPHDLLWMVVKRTINSVVTRNIEYMSDRFDKSIDSDAAFYVDAGIVKIDASSTFTAVAGLDHLEGETVSVFADNVEQAQKTVSSGAITMATAANRAHVGLPITSVMKTMPLVFQTDRDPRGILSRHFKTFIELFESYDFKIKQNDEDLETVDVSNLVATEPADGLAEINIPSGSDRQPTITISTDSPSPLTILSMIHEIQTGGI